MNITMKNTADLHRRTINHHFMTKTLKLDTYINTILQQIQQKIQDIEDVSTNIIADSNANDIDHFQKV